MERFWQQVIGRQFVAAIQTIRAAVEACPDDLWDDRSSGSPFWHVAYHVLYYVDLYLSDDDASFEAPSFHVEKANFLPGDYGDYAGIVTTPEVAIPKTHLLEHADHCVAKCDAVFAQLTDERALERCGFWWYPLNVGEFLLNNLRHAQHHAGQLTLLVRRHADIGIEWLGTRDNEPAPPTW